MNVPNASTRPRRKFALRCAGWHLLASILVAAIAALLVFQIWYPAPYHAVLGVGRIFALILAVHVVCGPALTLLVVNPAKSKRELRSDVALILLIQTAALGYGLHTIGSTRPSLVVFERDRFVIVRASEIDPAQLDAAPVQFRQLTWRGPQMASTRSPRDAQELLAGIEMSMRGLGPSLRPDWWTTYEPDIPEVMARSRALGDLIDKRPEEADVLIKAVQHSGHSVSDVRYLPLTAGEQQGWTALIDDKGRIVGAAPVDGFDD